MVKQDDRITTTDEIVTGETVTVSNSSVQTIQAQTVTLDRSNAQSINAQQVKIKAGGSQKIEAVEASIERGGAVFIRGQSVSLVQGGALAVVADEATLQGDGLSLVVAARQANTAHQRAVFLLAGRVEGDVQTAFDTQGAFLFGATLGAMMGLFLLLRDFLSRE